MVMKERSRERIARLLLEELFAELGEDADVLRMLGDLSSLPPDVVVGRLSADVIEAIARRREEALAEAAAVPPPPAIPPEPPPVLPPPQPETPASPVAEAPRPAEPEPPEPPSPPPPAAVEAEPPVSPAEPAGPEGSFFWGELESVIRKERTSGTAPPEGKPEEPPKAGEEEYTGSLAEADAGELRTAVEFGDEDTVYVHAVAMVPETQTPAEVPYMLEEKGIDRRAFAFAFDYEGMRFYLSRVMPNVMNVSKTGVLLLSKQESLEAVATHESALNELRLHGMLLPFAFGTIARGRDDLMSKVDDHRQRLTQALEAMEATRWWVVKLSVLDARIAQLVGKDEPPPARRGRTVERTSYTKTPVPKKFDIKVLERILGKEKRIAESVHEELKNTADRSDVDMIVGLGSGSSDDWKQILTASYEVQASGRMKFFRTVADLQYRHLTIDLMLSVAGDAEPFAFTRS